MVTILVEELVDRLKGQPDKKPLRQLNNAEFDLLPVVLEKRGLAVVPPIPKQPDYAQRPIPKDDV